ncbi:helix-turn-helix domain-containing protein [Frigoriglobus tundricola]|uniref:Uncharacterized protein n=1 Tax=Frigoriglobus tundricola TaxID=2774151 RepID=A0A6M5YIQ1_9BACT|nr:helix-turn-helix transcriptional regulator [Frigoriglobus tundricola]QJW93123.1 hypothetical protein FTUN_0626 [Frigoriglobus tundricola]
MGRRTQADDSEKGSGIAERLKHLRDLLWDGNNSRMGRELGNISHPVISRVLAGDQPPPGKLLEALAKWPGLNVRWLFAGEGEPLSERGLGAGGGHFSPIARELLPGEPGQHPELLTQTSLPVAAAFYSTTAYWFPVPKGHALTKDTRAKLAAGDYLLIETSPNWTLRELAYADRLCVFTVGRPSGCVLAVVDRGDIDPEPPFTLRPFWEYGDAVMVPSEDSPHPEDGPRPDDRKKFRFYRNDLVGVCRQLCRLDPAAVR